MSTSRHEVGHFEIPADNVDGLRSFYSINFVGNEMPTATLLCIHTILQKLIKGLGRT